MYDVLSCSDTNIKSKLIREDMLLGSMWDYSAAINYSTFTFIVDTKQSNKVSASFSKHVKKPWNTNRFLCFLNETIKDQIDIMQWLTLSECLCIIDLLIDYNPLHDQFPGTSSPVWVCVCVSDSLHSIQYNAMYPTIHRVFWLLITLIRNTNRQTAARWNCVVPGQMLRHHVLYFRATKNDGLSCGLPRLSA